MKRYFKVVCAQEEEKAGAGLGYEELFGSRPRYFWDEHDASKRAQMLNAATQGHRAYGDYAVEMRNVYDDGSFDDEDDNFARQQLGL